MSKPFFFLLLTIGFAVILFMPFFLKAVIHYDMNRKKFCFSLYLFHFIKLVGGYIATYKGGLVIHLSDKKAVLLEYGQIEGERQRFSFVQTFHLSAINVTVETGAEYLLPAVACHNAFNGYFMVKGWQRKKIENNLWLSDGDKLRISLSILTWFNLFIILKNLIKFLKEKVQLLWQKKVKN